MVHKKNLFTTVKIMAFGVTWLLTCEGVVKSTVDVGNSNLLSSPAKIEGETGFVSF